MDQVCEAAMEHQATEEMQGIPLKSLIAIEPSTDTDRRAGAYYVDEMLCGSGSSKLQMHTL